jgi:two-component system sensor histidine kinase/response regulator
MGFRTSIQQKILLLLLSLALPPLLLVGWLSLTGLARARDTVVADGASALRLQKETELAQRAADKAALYNLALASIAQQVETVAGLAVALAAQPTSRTPTADRVWVAPAPSPELLAANAENVALAQQLIPALRSAVAANPLVNIGYVALDDGGVIAFDNEGVVDKLQTIQPFDPRTRPWYTTARVHGETVWVDTYVDANTGELLTTCATPLYDPSGRFIGVVAFDLLLRTIQEDLLRLDVGQDGYALLLNEAGEVIIRPDMEASATPWNRPFATENLRASSSPDLRAVAEQMVDSKAGIALIRPEGPSSAMPGDDGAGASYIAYAPIPAAGWSVALVVPEREVVEPALRTARQIGDSQVRLRNQLLGLLLFALLTITALGFLLSLSFTGRIRSVQQGVQAVARGNLSQRIPPAGRDEIGQLVEAFNGMTVALREKIVELEENARQLATLNEVSNELKSILDLPQLLDAIPGAICRRFGFDRAAVYLVEGRMLRVVAAAFGPGVEGAASARHFMEVANSSGLLVDGRSLEADVLRSGKAIIVDNPWEHPAVEPRKQAVSASHSYVQVPIFGRDGRPIGLLSADKHISQRPILAEDAGRLLMFANMVGLTIQNVQLFSDLERQVARRTEELRAALDRAQLADRRKSDFLASVSHELRTPLNAIIGFSTVLLDDLDGPLTPPQREDVQSINRNGRFLLHLITELLDLAKIEAGHLTVEIARLDLRKLVADTVDTVQGIVRPTAVGLRHALPPALPPVLADPDRVRQVLLNLLSNAVKFTERGTITVSADVVDELADDGRIGRFVVVRVADTGMGIPPERHAEVFEEFVQIHGRRSRVAGTGLGLAIARKLVEAQRGRIWVESAPGRSSTFSFTLPVAQGQGEGDAGDGGPLPVILDGAITTEQDGRSPPGNGAGPRHGPRAPRPAPANAEPGGPPR